MDARRRDVLTMMAARAHDDAHPETDRETATRLGTSRRTANAWRTAGPPAVRAFQTYLLDCGSPWRIAADAQVSAKVATVKNRPTAELIEDYRACLAHECDLEGDDRRCDVTRGTPWLDRATASTRDAANDAHKAALELEFAARGLTEADVFGADR